MMRRLLNLFLLLRGATSDALRIREFYVSCFIGWLDSFFLGLFQHHWGGWGRLGAAWELSSQVINNAPRL